ncbi:hypothetical protein [Veillonella caviae]|uniref:hypothetical protein n=1 Tax=Veillonella caviae TaxID=248316 RepID=UPI0023A7FC1A|nr:hypothetical protein [Veillonella caviae]MCI5708964.1 hypothetical protein [Veillonella caviae]MCI6407675.1 hypothetical protein [Veillonella caviae]MDY5714959.1 hypothetical protein [Veillonella caviae]MDY6225793.1 hypothetical protein [Veillonella caviae]
MKIIKDVTPIEQRYIQFKHICTAYDLSRMQVYRLTQRMKHTTKYKNSFVELGPKCKLVKIADFEEFFQSIHNSYLTESV